MAQRALTRLYARDGVKGLVVAGMIGSYTAGAFAGLVLTLNALRFLDASSADTMRYVLLVQGLWPVIFLVGNLAARDVLRVILTWTGESRTAERAPDMWRTGITGPRRLVTTVGITAFVFTSVGTVFAIIEFDQPIWIFVPATLLWAIGIFGAAVFAMLGLEFHDDRGFDTALINGSAGIQNMTDRIGALGGTVRINSIPGRGTRVEGVVPL